MIKDSKRKSASHRKTPQQTEHHPPHYHQQQSRPTSYQHHTHNFHNNHNHQFSHPHHRLHHHHLQSEQQRHQLKFHHPLHHQNHHHHHHQQHYQHHYQRRQFFHPRLPHHLLCHDRGDERSLEFLPQQRHHHHQRHHLRLQNNSKYPSNPHQPATHLTEGCQKLTQDQQEKEEEKENVEVIPEGQGEGQDQLKNLRQSDPPQKEPQENQTKDSTHSEELDLHGLDCSEKTRLSAARKPQCNSGQYQKESGNRERYLHPHCRNLLSGIVRSGSANPPAAAKVSEPSPPQIPCGALAKDAKTCSSRGSEKRNGEDKLIQDSLEDSILPLHASNPDTTCTCNSNIATSALFSASSATNTIANNSTKTTITTDKINSWYTDSQCINTSSSNNSCSNVNINIDVRNNTIIHKNDGNNNKHTNNNNTISSNTDISNTNSNNTNNSSNNATVEPGMHLPLHTTLPDGGQVTVDAATELQVSHMYALIQQAAMTGEGYGVDEYPTESDFRQEIKGGHTFVITTRDSEDSTSSGFEGEEEEEEDEDDLDVEEYGLEEGVGREGGGGRSRRRVRGHMIAAFSLATSKFYRGSDVKVADPIVIVTREERRKGIGEFVFRHAVQFSRRLGFVGIYTDTFSNNTAMIRIIERTPGFKLVGYLPLGGKMPDGTFVGANIYFKDLRGNGESSESNR